MSQEEEKTGLLSEEEDAPAAPPVKPLVSYNPFGGDSRGASLTFPEAAHPTAAPAPAASSSSSDAEALRLREADVARREAACLAREQELQRQLQQAQYREERSAVTSTTGGRQKNWPRCFPLIRHAIDEDIEDPQCRMVVRLSFVCFWCQAAWLLMNFIVMLGQIFLVSAEFPFTFPNFTLSIFYALFLPPLFFVFGYRPLYTGCRKGRRALIVGHMLSFGVEVFMQFFFFLGFEPYGASGAVMMAKLFRIDGARPFAMLFLVGFIASALVLIFQVIIYIMVIRMFRHMFPHAAPAAAAGPAAPAPAAPAASGIASTGGLASSGPANYGSA